MKTLAELKAEYAELTSTEGIKSQMACIDLHKLIMMGTEKPAIEDMNEADACKVYELRNNLLKAKLKLLDDVLKAIRTSDEKLLAELDYFKERKV